MTENNENKQEEARNETQMSIKDAYEKNKTRKEERLKELGLKPLLHLGKSTHVEIDMAKPMREVQTKYGLRYVYSLVNQPDKELMCSETLHDMVIDMLGEGENSLIIIKTGEGKDTRYDIDIAK